MVTFSYTSSPQLKISRKVLGGTFLTHTVCAAASSVAVVLACRSTQSFAHIWQPAGSAWLYEGQQGPIHWHPHLLSQLFTFDIYCCFCALVSLPCKVLGMCRFRFWFSLLWSWLWTCVCCYDALKCTDFSCVYEKS